MTSDEERARKYWDHIADIKRMEELEDRVKSVWHTYKLLAHLAEDGSPEEEEFERLERYYSDMKRDVFGFDREEQDRILEEYPKLVSRLNQEHDL